MVVEQQDCQRKFISRLDLKVNISIPFCLALNAIWAEEDGFHCH